MKFPTTTHDWQLYHNYKDDGRTGKPMKGAPNAARALTAALRRASIQARVRCAACTTKAGVQGVLSDLYLKEIEPVMLKHSKVGAYDTEPRTVAKEYLNGIANECGWYGFIDF